MREPNEKEMDSLFNDNSGGTVHIYNPNNDQFGEHWSLCGTFRTDDPVISKDTSIDNITCGACWNMWNEGIRPSKLEQLVESNTRQRGDGAPWFMRGKADNLKHLDEELETEMNIIYSMIYNDDGDLMTGSSDYPYGYITMLDKVLETYRKVRMRINGYAEYDGL